MKTNGTCGEQRRVIKPWRRLCLLILLIPVLFPVWSSVPIPREDLSVIAVIKDRNIPPADEIIKGFYQKLSQRPIPFRLNVFDLDVKDLPRQVREIKPKIILTIGTRPTRLAYKEFQGKIPIIFTMVMDPTRRGFVTKELQGVSLDIPPKLQLEHLKMIAPKAKKIGVVYSQEDNISLVKQARIAAESLELELQDYRIYSQNQIPRIKELPIDALWLIPDLMLYQPAIVRRLLFSCVKKGIPVMGRSAYHVKAGALLGLSCDYGDIGRQAAEMTLKILSGETLSKQEIINPRKTKLYLNHLTAEQLGIKLPREVLQKAEKVFGK